MADPDARVTVTLDLTVHAATDVLLAVEAFADRVYGDRASHEDIQVAYNQLGDFVLPLRAARDEALREE